MWACPIEEELYTDDKQYRKEEKTLEKNTRTRHANQAMVDDMMKDLDEFTVGDDFVLQNSEPVVKKKGKAKKGGAANTNNPVDPGERKNPRNLPAAAISLGFKLQSDGRVLKVDIEKKIASTEEKYGELLRYMVGWIFVHFVAACFTMCFPLILNVFQPFSTLRYS